MDFGHDERTHELCAQLQSFMDSHIYPAEPVYARTGGQGRARPATRGIARPWSPSSRQRPASAGCGTCSCPGTPAVPG